MQMWGLARKSLRRPSACRSLRFEERSPVVQRASTSCGLLTTSDGRTVGTEARSAGQRNKVGWVLVRDGAGASLGRRPNHMARQARTAQRSVSHARVCTRVGRVRGEDPETLSSELPPLREVPRSDSLARAHKLIHRPDTEEKGVGPRVVCGSRSPPCDLQFRSFSFDNSQTRPIYPDRVPQPAFQPSCDVYCCPSFPRSLA